MDRVGVQELEKTPVEYLVDQHLSFVTSDNTLEYKVSL